MIAYIALFSDLLSWALTALACGSTWVTSFIACFWISTKVVFTVLSWLVPHETAAVSVQVLCTPYSHTLCHVTSYKNTKLPTYLQNHIRRVHACLAVTCHLHFWQNDRDLLRATAVTREWNEYEIRVSTECWSWRRKILLQLLRRLEPATFRSRVRHSNYWPILDPQICSYPLERKENKT